MTFLAVFLLQTPPLSRKTLRYSDHQPLGDMCPRYRQVQSSWAKEQEGKGVKDAGAVLAKISVIMDDALR